jgi:hypothetical protein
LELFRRRIIAQEPVILRAVPVDDYRRRCPADAEFLEDRIPFLVVSVSPEEDEILVQEILELGILVKLLTQQSAAPSTTRVEVEEDEFVFGLGLGHGLVERAFEPVLGRSARDDEENER